MENKIGHERERRMKALQVEIDRLQETIDELRRHA